MPKLLAAVLAASCAAAWAGEAPPAPVGNPAMGVIDGPAMDRALTRVETLHAEVKTAIVEARKAATARTPTTSHRAELVSGLKRRLESECAAAAKPQDFLRQDRFTEHAGALLSYQACVAADAKSFQPCGALSGLSMAPAGSKDATHASPEALCRDDAARIMMLRALLRGTGAGVCSLAAGAFFAEFPADRASRACSAMLSSGVPAQACAAVGREISLPADAQAECRSLVALRTAKDSSACSALPKELRAECVAVFSEKACAERFSSIVKIRCAAEARDRLATMNAGISAQEAQMATTAAEAALAKRKEIDDLLVRIGAALDAYEPKSDPKYLKRRDRYTRARAGVDATLNAYFGTQQKKQ